MPATGRGLGQMLLLAVLVTGQRDQDPLSGYDITPANGTAPVRLATRDFNSFFQGSIAKVAFYPYEVSAAVLARHYRKMTGG